VLISEVEMVDISEGPPEAPQVIDEGDFIVTDSGLKYYDFEEGSGPEIEMGSQVQVDYTGWLEDGSMFDSSIGKQPFGLVVGTGSVIAGWDEGLQGMKLGGRRQLVVPAELGYGESGSGPIPPNSVLIFEVEIVDVQ
jgi:peptidylprolyl isomerase